MSKKTLTIDEFKYFCENNRNKVITYTTQNDGQEKEGNLKQIEMSFIKSEVMHEYYNLSVGIVVLKNINGELIFRDVISIELEDNIFGISATLICDDRIKNKTNLYTIVFRDIKPTVV